jgi:hypothetical protein
MKQIPPTKAQENILLKNGYKKSDIIKMTSNEARPIIKDIYDRNGKRTTNFY